LDPTIFLAVLLAALLHASWNILVKLNLDRFLALFLIQTLMGGLGLAMVLVFTFPAQASWPYAAASGVLHTGYNLFLARSYQTGDLSQVYPIARGTAPLMTLVGSWALAGEAATPLMAGGILLLVLGIWTTAINKEKSLRLDGLTLFFALGTSVFVAAYTIVDGLGGRASGSPSGYAGLVFLLDALMLLAVGVQMRGPGIIATVAPFWKSGLAGAAFSVAAYWIVIWAMSIAHIAAVAALRESSILFVMLMSLMILKERVTWSRMGGAALIVAGAAALRMA
jgi:drug/metabolite transporter (DMT)-like permease